MSSSHAARVRKRLARPPTEVWTSRLEDEPAVRAWNALGAGPRPPRLELLRRRRKSVVYRLPGVGAGGSDVIAKQALWQDALDERAVYVVLSELPLQRIVFYGFVPEQERAVGWLFMEDAGSEPWDPTIAAHRIASTGWLAELHTTSSQSNPAARLPDRGLAWVRQHLDHALSAIPAGFANPALASEARPVLDDALRVLAEVASCWHEIEAECASMPRALVHCDFGERNVRIREENGEPRVLAFDFEVAGWGLPAVDLPVVDMSVYADAVGPHWPGLSRTTLDRFASLGLLMRGGVIPTSWAVHSLATTFPAEAVAELAIYPNRMAHALAELGLRESRAAS